MKTAELNQPIYFKNICTLEWKLGNVLCWGRGYAFVCTDKGQILPRKTS